MASDRRFHKVAFVVVFYAMFGTKRQQWLYPLATAIHALTDIPVVLYQAQILKSVTTEVLTGLSCAALIVMALAIHQKLNAPFLSQPRNADVSRLI
jgi:uncharacterized membrane protein YhfC